MNYTFFAITPRFTLSTITSIVMVTSITQFFLIISIRKEYLKPYNYVKIIRISNSCYDICVNK